MRHVDGLARGILENGAQKNGAVGWERFDIGLDLTERLIRPIFENYRAGQLFSSGALYPGQGSLITLGLAADDNDAAQVRLQASHECQRARNIQLLNHSAEARPVEIFR